MIFLAGQEIILVHVLILYANGLYSALVVSCLSYAAQLCAFSVSLIGTREDFPRFISVLFIV